MTGKNFEIFRKIYRLCCDCYDLADSVGNRKFMDEFEKMLDKLNQEMYSSDDE